MIVSGQHLFARLRLKEPVFSGEFRCNLDKIEVLKFLLRCENKAFKFNRGYLSDRYARAYYYKQYKRLKTLNENRRR